ncbi:MAG: TIGR04438 family Trp-rich protein [Burkholderiaceae bacterium]|jgi:small Trp-rich protein|nr:TIGR04438 family Trp-rich protein [Burkholderiaceae bacterium]
MYLVGIGVILLLMKWQEYGFVAEWSWWWVLSPFAGAVLWWWWADASGYTKRKAMEQENEVRQKRIDRNREAIGRRIRGR